MNWMIDFSDRRYFIIKDQSALRDETGDDADGGVLC